MKMIGLHRLIILSSVICISTMMVSAVTVVKGNVKIQYEDLDDGSINVINVWNLTDERIDFKIDGIKNYTLNAGGSAQLNLRADKYVRFDFNKGGGELLWKKEVKEIKPVPQEPEVAVAEPPADKEVSERVSDERRKAPAVESVPRRAETHVAETSIGYNEKLNQDEFFGLEAVTEYTGKVENLCRSIDSSKNKSQFIIDNDVELFLQESENEISEKRINLPTIARYIVEGSNLSPEDSASTITNIIEILTGRLRTREELCQKLRAKVSAVAESNDIGSNSFDDSLLNYGIVGAIVLLLIILMVVVVRRKKKRQNKSLKPHFGTAQLAETSSDNPAIVVRRRTTSILKKQCIDDVINNPAYLMINASDFTTDSAVRKIYVKNSCIKEVYNLYADDLRDTENPKEDGCMVLGRWVHDEADNTYDVSLEEVIFPGDDAIFKEYELNFGGKIKLRVAEKLRKLRRDTNLQYDLVCWIHSHPGLGVFFSNSDDNVQTQLKHSQHPNFLIAFVVDILTTDQEMGIFTFRKDGNMNSKGDITKMYSLEEMYKWALQSELSSFSPENYFNILENAKLKLPSCNGVELNNSSIIDLTQIVVEPETGIVGWAIGTTVEKNGMQEFVVSGIVRKVEKTSSGVIGCLISMIHMSFPTIQRLIARDSVNLSFVMVYSSKQMSLTTIPVINGELLSDEQFYGDVNIEDLKIWTRRKR